MPQINRIRAKILFGRLLSAWSAVTLVLLIVSMLALPWAARRVSNYFETALTDLSSLTDGIALAVQDAEDALQATADTLEASALALDAAHANIEDIKPMLQSVHTLLSVEAPDTLIATQQALESAQSGAKAMDQVLRVLSSLRFLTGVRYDPEQSLDVALQGVSESLDSLPAGFVAVSDDLEDVQNSLEDMEPEILRSIKQLRQMSKSMTAFSRSVAGQAEDLEILSDSLGRHAGSVAARVRIGVFVLELMLFQLVLTQIALIYVGQLMNEKQD